MGNNLEYQDKDKNYTKHCYIYTDGSCVNKVGGFGFVLIKNKKHSEFYGKVPIYPCTNNIAELYAIKLALTYCNYKNIVIYTDSKYSIGCLVEWCKNWKMNGWINSKGKPVENQVLIKDILKLMKNRNIEFKHVKAHNGDKYNEMADSLANKGRMIYNNK